MLTPSLRPPPEGQGRGVDRLLAGPVPLLRLPRRLSGKIKNFFERTTRFITPHLHMPIFCWKSLILINTVDTDNVQFVFPAYFRKKVFDWITAGASSQCYWDELMLLKCEVMLLKCQINTKTSRNGFLISTKCLERVLKYSYLVSIIIFLLFMFIVYNHFVLIWHFTSISSNFNSISSSLNSIRIS